MTVEALNCPNCGAGVASNSTQCEFCKTRLKTVACPSCFGLMFVGSQFCGHCGAKAVPTDAAERNVGDCPRCRRPLNPLSIGDTAFRHAPAQRAGAYVFEKPLQSVATNDPSDKRGTIQSRSNANRCTPLHHGPIAPVLRIEACPVTATTSPEGVRVTGPNPHTAKAPTSPRGSATSHPTSKLFHFSAGSVGCSRLNSPLKRSPI